MSVALGMGRCGSSIRVPDRALMILFVKPLVDLSPGRGADVLSVDLAEACRRLGQRVAFQGNVDHQLLLSGSKEEIDEAATSRPTCT